MADPIETPASEYARGAGLGSQPYRAKERTSSAKALVSVLSKDSNTVYGYLHTIRGTEFIQPTTLDEFGRPTYRPNRRSAKILRCDHHRVRNVLWWSRGAIGIAETTYPHPCGWTYLELDSPITLDRQRIRHLTAAHRRKATGPPTCQNTWEKILGQGELQWKDIWARLNHVTLTNQDMKNNSRIIHRSVKTRNW